MKSSTRQQETREAILNATDRLLSRNGYKKMTIDDLAKEVGIGKGSVYLHFTSKEEIVLSHIDRIVDTLKVRLWAIAEEKSPADERIRRMLTVRVLHRFDSVQHYTQSLNDLLAALRPKFLARRKQYFVEEARIFATVISSGQEAGSFVKGNADALAEALIVSTNSMLPFSLTAQELGERGEIEERVGRVANVLLQGLCTRT